MNRSNRVAKTKGLISFAVAASFFAYAKNAFFMTDSSNFPQIRI